MKNFHETYWRIMLVIISLVIGVVGFALIESLSFIDALYMAVTTVSTVGFGEVKSFSPMGRLFVSFYVSFNLVMFAYFTVQFIEKKIENMFGKEYMQKEIDKLDGHIIVCGYGRNGQKVAEELIAAHKKFVIIERENANISQITRQPPNDFFRIEGDATDDEVLKRAGITRASVIITTLPDDANNVFITLTAREFNNSIRVIARASQESSLTKLHRAGAANVVMPDAIGGWHMANLVTRPEVIEFLNLLNGAGVERFKLEEISYENILPFFRYKPLIEWDLQKRVGVVVMGLKNEHKQFTVSPGEQTIIKPAEILIVFGNEASIKKMQEIYCS